MSILQSKSQGKGGPDKIFAISDLAKKRAAEVGKGIWSMLPLVPFWMARAV